MKASEEGKRIENAGNKKLAKVRKEREDAKLKEEFISTLQKSENSKRITWEKAKKEIASWR